MEIFWQKLLIFKTAPVPSVITSQEGGGKRSSVCKPSGLSWCFCVLTDGQDGRADCQRPCSSHLAHAADDGVQHRSPSHVCLW